MRTEMRVRYNQIVKYENFRQIDDCRMRGPSSVRFSPIHMAKMESEIITLLKPKFYRRSVNDIFNQLRKILKILFSSQQLPSRHQAYH